MSQALLARRARRELLAATRWIARENPAAAQALRDAVAKAATLIGDYGEIGTSRSELADMRHRFLTLTGFPYIVAYDAERDPALLVRIVHSVRDLPRLLRDLLPR
jgi:toxin ParE1/3/4